MFEIPGEQIEEYVWGVIMRALKNPEAFIRDYLGREHADPTKIERIERDLNQLRQSRANAELAIERIETAHDDGRYSAEKMSEKVAAKNLEIGQIDNRIQDLEDELRLLTAVDVEVQKLKSAAEQVKYRLDHLGRREKKIICQLFVDRVEMRREPRSQDEQDQGRGRWRTTAKVYFRFNPKTLGASGEGGRTQSTLQEDKKGSSLSQNGEFGAPGGI